MLKKYLSYLRFFPVQLIVGIFLCSWLPILFNGYLLQYTLISMGDFWGTSLLVLSSLVTIYQIRKFPGIISFLFIFHILLFLFFSILLFLLIVSFSFSSIIFTSSAVFLLIYLFIIEAIMRHYEMHIFAYIPVGRAIDMPEQIPSVQWVELYQPLLKQKVKGIVTDLHCNDLDGDWERFIAEQTLQGIPVYHYRNIRESLTGRVRITHLYENELGSLLPSENYIFLKRIISLLLVIFFLLVTLPIMLITALFIRLESPGNILFTQKRIGQYGKEFVIYKFRSMCANSEAQGAKMASANDMRITRVGKFIRKTRIDELPQFFNVLKGDMSLIGPRPEQKVFVEHFEKTIPFYNYRHIVKPGITGWAQVTQGYAGNEDETRIKVEYDFFYIKHFSFSLDLLIFFKTIRTMLTGFGAR